MTGSHVSGSMWREGGGGVGSSGEAGTDIPAP